jgi:CheY-like chemotaxis protein
VDANLPLRVLLIDDDEDTTKSFAMLFRLWGHKPIVAKDGDDGLKKARVFRPDLVLADVAMPGLTGLDFATAFRLIPAHRRTPLIAVTGMQRYQEACLKAGFSHYLLKPVDPNELRGIVEEVRSKVAVDLNLVS